MAEGARLESVYTATYRGFESPPHRHLQKRARTKVRALFYIKPPAGGMRTPDRGSTTGAASWTDHEHREWAARRASKASQSPLTAIFKKEPVRKWTVPQKLDTQLSKVQSIPRALPFNALLTVGVKRSLTKRRAHAVVFIKTHYTYHLIFTKTG